MRAALVLLALASVAGAGCRPGSPSELLVFAAASWGLLVALTMQRHRDTTAVAGDAIRIVLCLAIIGFAIYRFLL